MGDLYRSRMVLGKYRQFLGKRGEINGERGTGLAAVDQHLTVSVETSPNNVENFRRT
jgi:hypothetical protein